MTTINIIIKRLTDINIELIRKYGTDAYEIRCKIFDIKNDLSEFHEYDISRKALNNKEDDNN
jgi:hypothetical protein